MRAFLDKDFLLNTEAAKKLYHEAAEQQPIIDYHCHLNPKEIWEDIDKMADLLLNLGIICQPKYQIRTIPLVTNHEFDTGRRIVYVEVTKDGINYKRIPHFFNEFLHVVEDPDNRIGKYIEEMDTKS